MDKDRVAGSAKKVGGDIKEAAGRALGDRKMESEGRAKKTEGKVQNAVGGARDKIRESVKND
ncbi:MAG: CsbD family protein [Stellaceae bacterium]